MDILWLLVPLSVLIALGIGIVFVWSARSGQFDDLDSAALDILTDERGPLAGAPPSRRAASRDPRPAPPDAPHDHAD